MEYLIVLAVVIVFLICWFITLVYKVSLDSKERDKTLRKDVDSCSAGLGKMLTVDSHEAFREEFNLFLSNTNKDIYKEFGTLKNRADGLDSIVDSLRKEVSESGKMVEVTVRMNEELVARELKTRKPARKTITKNT